LNLTGGAILYSGLMATLIPNPTAKFKKQVIEKKTKPNRGKGKWKHERKRELLDGEGLGF